MLREQLLNTLKELKLHGMTSVLDEVLATGTQQKAIPEKIVLELLKAELAERQARSIRYRMGQAKFPVAKDLDQFDFTVSPVNETQVRTLYEGQFLATQSNVILVGGTGTGKTHLAIAIARQMIRTGKRCVILVKFPLGLGVGRSAYSLVVELPMVAIVPRNSSSG